MRSKDRETTWKPITGQEIEAVYKELMDRPPAVVDLVKKLEGN